MEPVKDLAEKREREAAAEVARARKALEDAELQLKKLEAYRADYLEGKGKGESDGVRIQNFHAFIGRLTGAIEQQGKEIVAFLAALERATDAWRERRIEAASLGRVVAKLATGERRVADQRAQREADERSIQRVILNRDPT